MLNLIAPAALNYALTSRAKTPPASQAPNESAPTAPKDSFLWSATKTVAKPILYTAGILGGAALGIGGTYYLGKTAFNALAPMFAETVKRVAPTLLNATAALASPLLYGAYQLGSYMADKFMGAVPAIVETAKNALPTVAKASTFAAFPVPSLVMEAAPVIAKAAPVIAETVKQAAPVIAPYVAGAVAGPVGVAAVAAVKEGPTLLGSLAGFVPEAMNFASRLLTFPRTPILATP